MQDTSLDYKIQSATAYNYRRRWKRRGENLIKRFYQVVDGRSNQGKRHQLVMILIILLYGISAGSKNPTECLEKAKREIKFLSGLVDFPHGIPVLSTVSRALEVCDVESLVKILQIFGREIFGEVESREGASMDGKTLRGVHGEGVIRHMFTLVKHHTQRLIGQVGVTQKENEISACPRLLEQAEADLWAGVVTADALLTQTEIAKDIRSKGAHYLLTVKGNQAYLKEVLEEGFKDPRLKKQTHEYFEAKRGRQIHTGVEISEDFDMEELRKDWVDVRWLGKVIRQGWRPKKIQGSSKTREERFYEEVYFICSVPELTAEQAAGLIRGHWGIENRLHWQKDWTYEEDRQTLRTGNGPQVMSALRSFWLGVMRELGITKISKTLRDFRDDRGKHRSCLRQAYVFA